MGQPPGPEWDGHQPGGPVDPTQDRMELATLGQRPDQSGAADRTGRWVVGIGGWHAVGNASGPEAWIDAANPAVGKKAAFWGDPGDSELPAAARTTPGTNPICPRGLFPGSLPAA